MTRSRTWPAIAAATLALTTISGTAPAADVIERPAVALAGGSLLGTVSAETDGVPIAGVCIDLEANGGTYRTTTDPQGRWALTDLPAGPAFLVANACEDTVAGYATTWWPAAASPENTHPIPVERGQVNDGLDIALPRSCCRQRSGGGRELPTRPRGMCGRSRRAGNTARYEEVWFGGSRGPAMYEPDATTVVLDVEVGSRITGVDVRVQASPTMNRLCPWPQPSGATDVGDDHPHRDGIDCLSTYGVTTGRGDGTFAPNRAITRGQAATLLVRTLAVTDSTMLLTPPPHAFDDTRGNLHEEALDQLAALGILH